MFLFFINIIREIKSKTLVVVIIVIRSKFEFKKELIFSPKIYIIMPINRKRKKRPIIDAIINFLSFKFSAPAVKVNTL